MAAMLRRTAMLGGTGTVDTLSLTVRRVGNARRIGLMVITGKK
jgi:hypothetical protein